MSKGVISRGIECPIIREGDDLVKIVVDSVLEATAKDYDQMSIGGRGRELGHYLNRGCQDIIGITESAIARAAGLYVSVDDIAKDIILKFGPAPTIVLLNPIYSRNRFSMILKGIARAAARVIIYMPPYDEVGNPSGVNPFTGVDIRQYYKEIVESEDAVCDIREWELREYNMYDDLYPMIYCGLHDYEKWREDTEDIPEFITLADICNDKNPDFGLLGSNKATEERLKLFPTKAEAKRVCEEVKKSIYEKTGKDVVVMAYGDGCYKDFDAGIWECADPRCSPGYTDEDLLNSTPNEVKLKALIDKSASDAEVRRVLAENKDKNLKGNMTSQGTTPRRFVNLLASLMDLTSGSGDRGTPVVLVQNYFKEKNKE